MMKSAYTHSIRTAITLSIAFSFLLISGCSGGQKQSTIHMQQQSEADAKAAEEAKVLQAQVDEQQLVIDALVSEAHTENPYTFALEELLLLSQNPDIPMQSQGRAALEYAELLFEFEHPDALGICQDMLQIWTKHPYSTHTRVILAEAMIRNEKHDDAVLTLTQALQQPSDPYTLARIIADATPLLDEVAEHTSVNWMLAVAIQDEERRNLWLQKAAKYASLEYVLELRQSDLQLTAEQANFYRYAARERLMVGDYHAVRIIAKILELDLPDTEAATIVKHWAESEGQMNVVGVLLPLSGKYKAYGEQALQGIRMAMSRPEFEDSIILRIQDTASNADTCVSAYHQLVEQGVQWIIGPLLSDNTKALIPYLNPELPVISLASQVELASLSPSLFVHSLAKTIQADFMAHYILKLGLTRLVIIHNDNFSEQNEAAAFAQTFIDNGGEIIDILQLDAAASDHRLELEGILERTDDEELLAMLDDDLKLFSAEADMDIRMPLNMDGIYLTVPGRDLSVLAGQLAYADISNIPLYGSDRWFDGHLLDDGGRYLNSIRFATPFNDLNPLPLAILDVQNQYRVIWAQEKMGALFALAYDTAMNVAAIGTRLGLTGINAINALHDTPEFPAITGNFYFDSNGISQKTFAIQTIRDGRVELVKEVNP